MTVAIETALLGDRTVDPAVPRARSEGQTTVEVSYRALTLVAPDQVRFRHRLLGREDRWTEAGARRSARYVDLPPGTYRLEVSARRGDGPWSKASAAFAFEVLPPLHRRAWFVALCLSAVGLLAFTIHRLQVRQVVARYQAVLAERVRLAREIHDTLAQGFVAVISQLTVAARKLGGHTPEVALHLEEATEAARASLAEARRSVWELRADTDGGTGVMNAVRDIARHLEAGTTTRIVVSGELPRLPMSIERHLVRIVQEALTNAVRHAHARLVAVEAETHAHQARLSVRDDGVGFPEEGAPDAPDGIHHGLRGMRERAAELGARLHIRSGMGLGTEISIEVPCHD